MSIVFAAIKSMVTVLGYTWQRGSLCPPVVYEVLGNDSLIRKGRIVRS
jgi:hypothetical protein